LNQANQATDLAEQKAWIELGLTATELNPRASDFVNVFYSLKLLSEVASHNRTWQKSSTELQSFFTNTSN
jgi:hypothetical protein